MLAAENVILKNKFIAYVSDLEQCLFTNTLPSLAWKTAPQAPSADVLGSLAHASGSTLNVPLPPLQRNKEATLQQIATYSHTFDFNSYRMQNEREFYANYLDNYFSSKLHFIATTYTKIYAGHSPRFSGCRAPTTNALLSCCSLPHRASSRYGF